MTFRREFTCCAIQNGAHRHVNTAVVIGIVQCLRLNNAMRSGSTKEMAGSAKLKQLKSSWTPLSNEEQNHKVCIILFSMVTNDSSLDMLGLAL